MLSALLGLGFSHLSVRPPYSAESRTKFAEDSSQEGDGFEIQVPRQIDNALRRTRTAPLSASTLPPGREIHILMEVEHYQEQLPPRKRRRPTDMVVRRANHHN
jgi:hypothetical protein